MKECTSENRTNQGTGVYRGKYTDENIQGFEIKITTYDLRRVQYLATQNYCNCGKINDDKFTFSHKRKIFFDAPLRFVQCSSFENKAEMDEGKKKVELIETPSHLDLYLSV